MNLRIQELNKTGDQRPKTKDLTLRSLVFSLRSLVFNAAYFSFGLFYLPIFLAKTRQAENPKRLWRERLGQLPESWKARFQNQDTLWIHAVSVGEVLAISKLLEELNAKWPGPILLTTVTATGQRMALKHQSEKITVAYFPFDFSKACRNFFETMRPKAVVLVETEIWPNFLMEAQKANVPVGIINGRLSQKSAGRYTKIRSFVKPLFQSLSFVFAQSEEDAKRFVEAGTKPEVVEMLGNIKFDNVEFREASEADANERGKYGFFGNDLILIAGSTHPGEEGKVVKAYAELRNKFSGIRLILAPRHIERAPEIEKSVLQKGFRSRLASAEKNVNDFDVLILDRLGVLKELYKIADVVFMGGSLVRRGGQNPIEPASFKKPIIHGPHVFNFEKIYRMLDEEQAALVVTDEHELAKALEILLSAPDHGRKLGRRAFDRLRNLQGATQRHVKGLFDFFAERKEGIHVHA